MESRVHDVLAHVEPLFHERFLKSCGLIQKEYKNTHKSITKELFSAIESVVSLAMVQQEQGNKGPVQYLSFSYLRSELLLGTGAIRIDLYDKDFFCDLCETDGYWVPGFLQPYFCNDVQEFQKNAQKQFVRMRAFELDAIRNSYARYYWSIILKLIEDLLDEILALPALQKVKKAEEFLVTFGGYMDRGAVLWPMEKDA